MRLCLKIRVSTPLGRSRKCQGCSQSPFTFSHLSQLVLKQHCNRSDLRNCMLRGKATSAMQMERLDTPQHLCSLHMERFADQRDCLDWLRLKQHTLFLQGETATTSLRQCPRRAESRAMQQHILSRTPRDTSTPPCWTQAGRETVGDSSLPFPSDCTAPNDKVR